VEGLRRVEVSLRRPNASFFKRPPTVPRRTVMRITACGQGRDTLQTLTVALTNLLQRRGASRDGEG
jgi:hypothetical protein